MKKLLSGSVLALCFLVHAAHAQSDAKAKSILDAVTKKVNSMKSLKASFTVNLSGGKVNDSKSGSISLKGQKYHVTLSGQEIICDAKTVWTYTKETKEVQVSNYNPAEQTISPAKLLTNFYDKEYSYAYKGEKKEKGKSCDLLELVPNDKSKKILKIELLVDKASNMITSGTFTEKNGNKYNYSVSNITPNANIPETYFSWDPKEHAGVEVVDLR